MNRIKERFHYHVIGFRMLKIAHSIDNTLIPLTILDMLLQVLTSFVSLYLSARLIDTLLSSRYQTAVYFALFVISLNALCGILSHLLSKYYKKLSVKCAYMFLIMLREKAFSLDYESMEKPEVIDKILFSERTASMHGGLGSLVEHYSQLFKGLITILASVGMVISLCLHNPVEGKGALSLIASPFCSTLLFIIVFLVTGVAIYYFSQKRLNSQNEIFSEHATFEMGVSYLLDQVISNYKAGKVIRIFHMQDMLLHNLDRQSGELHHYYSHMCQTEDCNVVTETSIHAVFSVFSYLLVAVKVLTKAVSIGSFTQYVGALNQFGTACSDLIYSDGEIGFACIYMKDFLDFLDMENSHSTGSIPVEKREDGEYELAFEDVSFHYPGNENMVLEHVNCRLDMKDKMAVVGRNGAGKTTFIKLLCRLYEPTEGRITLNGVDIRKYDEKEYRDLFGVVFQDFKLFAFPVWENIITGYKRNDKKLWKCLKQAGAVTLVEGMPQNLDTLLYKDKENGVEISGGEAQKLALARALYKDAPVVILDEPTAALDPISEADVYAGFDEMVKDKTSIYISHRMSSCRFCNDIIVFDHGQIVERGSHNKLLSENGHYAKMWNAQAKYYEHTATC